jgi:tetratricopeptide (TPR) repeat protein
VTADEWRRVCGLYDRVAGAPDDERAALVRQLETSESTLWPEVARLLEADRAPDRRLDTPIARLVPPVLEPGTTLCGRFRLLRPLGEGGMGEVWAARDAQLNGDVALKMIRVSPLEEGDAASRFRREIQLARLISHPNVCRVHELLEDASGTPARLFLTMELLDGETLAARLKRGEPLGSDEALAIARAMADGLAAAHAAGIVHRDLKPANILLTPDGRRAVIMDFGLARASARADVDGATLPGVMVGTPGYMAPEQMRGMAVTPATDIYAAGVILSELFRNTTPNRRRVDRITARCLEFEPGKRYADGGEILAALNAVSERAATRGRRIWAGAAAAIGGVLVGVAGFGMWNRLQPVLPPAEALQWYDEAQVALAEGASVRASNALQRAMTLAPDFAPVYVALADIRLELEMPGAAQEALLKADALARDTRRVPAEYVPYVNGIHALLLRQCDQARDSLRQFADAAAGGSKAYRLVTLGRAMERCDRPDEAMAAMTEAAAIDPRNPAVPLRQAKLQFRRREFAAQAASLDRAEQLFRDRNNVEGIGEVLATRGTFAGEQGRLDAADAVLARAAELADSLDDVRLRIRALIQQAIVRRKQGQLAAATSLTTEAIDLARSRNLEPLTLEGLFAAGNVHVVRRQYEEARTLFERARTIAETYRHEDYQARAHLSLASVFVAQVRPANAGRALAAARPYYERTGHTRNLALANALAGQVRIMRAEYREAISQFSAAASVAREASDSEQEALAREKLATAEASAGRYPDALREYERVARIRGAAGGTSAEAFALVNVADLMSRLGRFGDAAQVMIRVAGLKQQSDDFVSRRHLVGGAIALRRGDHAEAVAAAAKARDSAADVPAERAVRVAELLCVAEASRNRPAESRRACSAMLAEARDIRDVATGAEIHLSAAEAYLQLGQRDRALTVAQDIEPMLVAVPEFHERWKLLAVLLAAQPRGTDDGELNERLTRELDRLRLQWGDSAFTAWRSRADVTNLLGRALASERR